MLASDWANDWANGEREQKKYATGPREYAPLHMGLAWGWRIQEAQASTLLFSSFDITKQSSFVLGSFVNGMPRNSDRQAFGHSVPMNTSSSGHTDQRHQQEF